MKGNIFTQALKMMTLSLAIISFSTTINAQSWQRVYANGQTNNQGAFLSTAIINNAAGAVGSNLNDSSNVNVVVTGEAWQELSFPESPGTNPIHVKIGKAPGVLDVLASITITARDSSGTAISTVSEGSILGLLGGRSQNDIVLNPPSNAASIRVTYSGIAIGGGIYLYAAYFDKPSSLDTSYNKAVDILGGTTNSLASALSVINSKNLAIDGNDTTTATIGTIASVANTNHLTALYTSSSAPGDSVRIVLNNPGSLLTVGLLSSGLTISTFDGNTETNLFSDETLLSLSLLSGETDKYVLTIPTTVKFDRIRVSMGGTLSTTYGLNVYEIGRKIPSVAFTQDTVIYDGTAIPTLTAESPNATDTIVWYSTSTPSGLPLAIGPNYTPATPPTENTNYYAFVKRNGTIQGSSVGAVYIEVRTLFVKPIVFLEGAYRSIAGAMTTSLSDNSLLPTTYGGATQLNINTLEIDGAGVVDWVTVELRDTGVGRSLLHSVPGILFSNGRVLAPVTLDSILIQEVAGTYFLLIKHRNHLGAATRVSLNTTASVVDFTLSTTSTSMQNIVDAKRMLYLGDLNSDNEINAIDFGLMKPLALEGAFDEYLIGDLDFNTEVNSIDFSRLRVKSLLSPFISYSGL